MPGFRSFRSAAGALFVSLSLVGGPVSAGEPATSLAAGSSDPVSRVFSARDTLDRDKRCGDAAKLVEQTAAPDATADTAVAAILALEKCATLPRTQGWTDYVDYTMTAAAACAIVAGRLTGNPKAYERAVADAKYVHGFDADSSTHPWVATTTRTGTVDTAHEPSQSQNDQPKGPVRYTNTYEGVASAPQPTEYGRLATDLAAIANTALKDLKK